MNLKSIRSAPRVLCSLAAAALLAGAPAHAAWEPTKPVEFVLAWLKGRACNELVGNRFVAAMIAKQESRCELVQGLVSPCICWSSRQICYGCPILRDML